MTTQSALLLSEAVTSNPGCGFSRASSLWPSSPPAETLTEQQRAAFRRFLGAQGYDTTSEDLMVNEAAAYLIHPANPRFFAPEKVDVTEAEANQLRAEFRTDMPDNWLLRGLSSP